MAAHLEILTSEQGGKKMYDGNVFYRKGAHKGSTYWKCKRCNARGTTTSTGNVVTDKKQTEHNHAPNQEIVQAEKVRSNLKRVAREHPEAMPAQILRTELPRVPSAVRTSKSTTRPVSYFLSSLYRFKKKKGLKLNRVAHRENLKKSLRCERRRNFPTEPVNLAELGPIPDKHRRTSDDANFILVDTFDEDEDEDRVIAFSTRKNINILANSSMWFLDGTFKTALNLFAQVYQSPDPLKTKNTCIS